MSAYTVVDAAAIPQRKRRGFVDITLARWAPFPDAAFHVEWAGDRAMVWAWSKSALRRVEGQDDAVPLPKRVLPESLFRGAPLPEGETLVAMDRGVEARVWRDYALVASEWWESAPALEEWNRFRRGAGLLPATAVAVVEQMSLADAPWSGKRARAVGDFAQEHGRHLAALALALTVATVSMPLAAVARLWVSTQLVERDIANQDAGLKRILDARDAVGRDLAAIQQMLDLRPPAGQIALMAAAMQLIPPGAGEVLDWQMPDASNLELTLRMENPDPATLARSWEASELFDAVNVELGQTPNEVRVKARIVRPAPAAGARR